MVLRIGDTRRQRTGRTGRRTDRPQGLTHQDLNRSRAGHGIATRPRRPAFRLSAGHDRDQRLGAVQAGSALANAGYVSVRKARDLGTRRTYVQLTAPGRQAFQRHAAALSRIVAAAGVPAETPRPGEREETAPGRPGGPH
ncbi:transcriptional regulator [Actinoallomurus bryophytorum]|uniref:transcriptional regulator n=1 Tax=Actinoallomurus bryophytorum TaxID=1490222 RepID=UPI001FE733E0|nr:transcriptional regulator [Actinoallomurus bryophytorum]